MRRNLESPERFDSFLCPTPRELSEDPRKLWGGGALLESYSRWPESVVPPPRPILLLPLNHLYKTRPSL